MSYWVEAKLLIKDLSIFKKVCENMGISYRELKNGHYELTNQNCDSVSGYTNFAKLVRKENEAQVTYYNLVTDSDINYNTFIHGLGDGACKLLQAYACETTIYNVCNNGGTLIERIEEDDGSILLRVAVGGY